MAMWPTGLLTLEFSWDWISKHLAAIFGSSGMMPSWEITSALSLP